jgi:hypothetical protein
MSDKSHALLLIILILLCNIAFCIMIAFGLNFLIDVPFTFTNIILFLVILILIQLFILKIVDTNSH